MSANVNNSMAGGPPRDIDIGLVLRLLEDHPMTRVSRIVGIHRNTLYNHLQNNCTFETKRREIAFRKHQQFVRAVARRASSAWSRERYNPSRKLVTLRGNTPKQIDLERVVGALKEKSVLQIARELGIHRNTLYNHLRYRPRVREQQVGAARRDPNFARAQIFVRRIAHEASNAYLVQEKFNAAQARLDAARQVKLEVGIGREFCALAKTALRVCTECLAAKPLTAFYYKKESQVYRRQCKSCCVKRSAEIWNGKGKFNRVRRSHISLPRLSETYPYIVSDAVEGADLTNVVNNLVPRTMPEAMRADICQDVLLAVLSGEVSLGDVAQKIKEYIKRFNKLFPLRREISIDAPLRTDGNYSLLDVISAEDYQDRMLMAYTSAQSHYGEALDDCEGVEDLAERLDDAWAANRLKTPNRKTYSRFSVAHEDDNRNLVVSSQISGHVGMGRKFRHTLKVAPPSRVGAERKLDGLYWAKEDYLEQRVAEERGL